VKKELKKLTGTKKYQIIRKKYHDIKDKLGENRLLKKVTKKIRVLPDFLIVGAQKSGTTFLFRNICAHSQVAKPEKKEVHYFDQNYEKSIEWYKSHFPTYLQMVLSKNKKTGEASPYYLYHPKVPKRISKVIPSVNIIIVLRDPVDRAISHYWHEVKKMEVEKLSIMEALKLEEQRLQLEKSKTSGGKLNYGFNHKHYSYKDRGKYCKQIDRYMKSFNSSQIKILKSKDLFGNTDRSFKEVCRFIGIESTKPNLKLKVNENKYRKNSQARSYLKKYFKEYNDKLNEEYEISF